MGKKIKGIRWNHKNFKKKARNPPPKKAEGKRKEEM